LDRHPGLSSIDQDPVHNLSWDDLVSLKRTLLKQINDLTNKIIDIENAQSPTINENIKQEKNKIVSMTKRLAQNRTEMNSNNSQLLMVSEKISKSKNFVSTMGPRIPSENEVDLVRILESSQRLIDGKLYKNEREKNETLSVMNDASMKLEAIKAIHAVNQQIVDLNTKAEEIKKILKNLDNEMETLQTKIADTQYRLDKLFEAKRQQAAERQSYLNDYDKFLSSLDSVNSRLDVMSRWRKRRRH
jgi:predicted  nucleic acid-binding Zn-ribbon protein